MSEVDCQNAGRMKLQRRIEDKLKLPVVATRAGTLFVLDSLGQDAKVLSSGDIKGASNIHTRSLRRKPLRKRRSTHYRLILRYPEVSAEAAEAVLKQLESASKKRLFIHITIDTGPGGFDWGRMQRYVSAVMPGRDKSAPKGKPKIVTTVRIEGAISLPVEEQINWLARQGIIARLVIGSALDYADGINSGEAAVLRAMAEQGLRTPVLFYWAGEERERVAETLRRALRLNKMSGIGILPYFMSARFDGTAEPDSEKLNKFSEVVEFLHGDRFLSEFLDEPVSDIEQRLAGSPEARCIRYVITPKGGLLPFRRFPFAANGPFKAGTYGPCRSCVWKHICGGVDSSPNGFYRRRHKIIADAWCAHRKLLMRRVAGECLEIREHLNRFKDRIVEAAT